MWWVTWCVVLLCGALPGGHGQQGENLLEESAVASLSVHSPTGGTAELPCDVTPTLPDDRMVLVIWYKRGHDLPIYSYDSRQGVTSHWSDTKTLGTRASFRVDTDPAVLVLNKLRPEDSGQYRCRVDFSQSPTKNARLNLTVLIPPERLIILDHEGGEVTGGVVGPYDAGSEVNLTCVAVGGRPTARVSWWKSHALLANSEARAAVTFTVSRAELGAEITCQAVTDPSMSPVSQTLTIDVNLRPLWVRLQGGRRPLVAGQHTELVCQAVGARPKPSLSWWRGGTRLNTVRETTSVDGNVTTSVLTYVPSIEDAGRVISCRAVQPTLSHSSQEDGWKMEIQHIPVVKLELGASLDGSNIVEGSDVYLDCRVRANPWHHHVYFTHNGVPVRAGAGTLLANQSLVLQGVSRRAAGAYVCAARNSLGEGASNKLQLDVKFAPTCRSGQPAVVRAARGESLDIACLLDANPSEGVAYSWWFNSSAHSRLELIPQPQPNEPLSNQKVPGSLTYVINSSSDYGWIQCSGRNVVGSQTRPCVYHILPADKPASPKSCEVTNVTYDSLTLNCTPGHDGGIKQSFLLQVFDASTGLLLCNVSSETAQFAVRDLTPGAAVALAVRAHNKKGASEPVTVAASLLKYPQRHTGQLPIVVQLTPLLACVAGVTVTLVALSAVVVVIVRCRHAAARSNGKDEKTKRQHDESSNVPLTDTKESDSVDSLDKNPDIIPLDGKIGDNSSNKSSTTDYSAIRPLISKPHDKYDGVSPCYSYDRYYETPVDGCNQYIQIRPIDYRLRGPQYGPTFGGQGQCHEGGSQTHRPPYDKVYEDWLKYKNALPLNTSGLLPPEQLLPPDPYSLYSQPGRSLHLAKMPELDPRGGFQLEPADCRPAECRASAQGAGAGAGAGRACQHERSLSPPVTFSMDKGSAYYQKGEGMCNTLPLMPRHRPNVPLPTSATPPPAGAPRPRAAASAAAPDAAATYNT